MRHNRSIYAATAVTLLIIIVVAYFFVSCSKNESAMKSNQSSYSSSCAKFTLKVSKDDGAKIEELINTLANTGTMGLAMKRKQLYKIGDIIDQNVPTLQFLAYIFSHPKLAVGMSKIRRSKLKYNNFVEGVTRNLPKVSSDPCFQSDVEGFAEFLKLNKKEVKRLVNQGVTASSSNKRSFKPLVNFLIDEKAH